MAPIGYKLLVTVWRRTIHHRATVLTGGSLLLHGAFTNVNSERMALLDRYRSAVDGLGGGDDDPATPPFREFDLEL